MLLPAPFGPKNPKISPSYTSKEILSIALKSPNFFVNESTSIACNVKSDFHNYNLITNLKYWKLKLFRFYHLKAISVDDWQ